MIGTPDRIRVRFEDERCEIHIVPASPGDVGSFALSGGGNTSYRITMRSAVQRWPQAVGEYNIGKYQSGILLRKVEE